MTQDLQKPDDAPEGTPQPAVNVNKMMDVLEARTLTLDEQYDLIQDIAIECVKSAVQHSNFDTANRLVLLLQTRLKKPIFNQLISWFLLNGPFSWKQTEDKKFKNNMKFRKAKNKNPKKFDIQFARDNPWYKTEEADGLRFRKTRTEEAPDFDMRSVGINSQYKTGEEE